jgi:diguanylate cyclase (GGDEF)-like protein/PAS domain S-box-containing protein
MDPQRISRNHILLAPIAILVWGGLFLVGMGNYPLFHSLVELFYLMISTAIMIAAWNSLLLAEGSFLTLIGVSFPFIALFVLLHFFTSAQINLFPGGDVNRSNQLWMGARGLFAATFLATSLLVGRKVRIGLAGLIYFAASLALLAAIWVWPIFPRVFIPGLGETGFMRLCEVGFALGLIAAGLIFIRSRARIEAQVFLLLQLVIGLSLVTELISAANLVALRVDDVVVSLSEVLAALMVYLIVVRSGLAEPYSTLAHDLEQSGQDLKRERDFVSAILDTADAVVVVLNNLGRIVRANRACQELTGYRFEELRGRQIWKMGIFPGDSDLVQQAFESQALDQLPRRFEGDLVTRDKRRVRLSWTNAILLDADRRVEFVISTGIDITARYEAEDHLRYLSNHDALTGLYNRAYFETELDRLMRSRFFPVSIIMVDVDGLKQVNDTRGHAAGDELLLHVAEILRAAFRTEDIVARIGGDEFCILLPSAGQDVTEVVLGRVKENLDLFNGVNPENPIDISMGAATAANPDGLTASLIKADQVMYEVKSSKPTSRD